MKKIIISILLVQSIFCFSQNIEKDCESARVKYLEQNPDVAKAGMNAWSHYISYGKNEGRKWPLCKSENEYNSLQLNLTTWKHSNGKVVQTEKTSNNYRKIWVEDDNRFFYEEISIEGQIVILKDINRNGVYLKLTPDVCYYKDNNNPSWLYIYSGSWSVPLKVIKNNNNVVSQTKNNSQTKTVVQSSKKEMPRKYPSKPKTHNTNTIKKCQCCNRKFKVGTGWGSDSQEGIYNYSSSWASAKRIQGEYLIAAYGLSGENDGGIDFCSKKCAGDCGDF